MIRIKERLFAAASRAKLHRIVLRHWAAVQALEARRLLESG